MNRYYPRSFAPWTEEQVGSLNAYQQYPYHHPFTHGEMEDQCDLIATHEGWVCYVGGPVVQTWAYPRMLNWSWKDGYPDVVL